MPSFLSANGPVREARFIANPDGTPDGGVHALFTITGRLGASGCTLPQPDFATQVANHNVIFRIPTPVFGAGLIEAIPDSAILASQAANAPAKADLGIRGRANFTVVGPDHHRPDQQQRQRRHRRAIRLEGAEQVAAAVLRRGLQRRDGHHQRAVPHRARRTRLLPDRSRAQRHHQRRTPLTTVDRDELDRALLALHALAGGADAVARHARRRRVDRGGRTVFKNVGCAFCHTPSFTTGNASVAALRNQPVNLFSDLLVHDMGVGLADGVSQGEAGPREFRSAPLWGLGQRLFFLHDGRTSNLITAIRAHASQGSEANGSRRRTSCC